MEYRLLGASGLEVSVLSFGTMTLGGEGRFAAIVNVQAEEARRQIEICIEACVNLFDTADIYSFGKSEEVLGQALGARRKDIVLATKVFVRLEPGTNKAGLSRRHILEACERASAVWEPITSISTRPTTSTPSRPSTRPCAPSTI